MPPRGAAEASGPPLPFPLLHRGGLQRRLWDGSAHGMSCACWNLLPFTAPGRLACSFSFHQQGMKSPRIPSSGAAGEKPSLQRELRGVSAGRSARGLPARQSPPGALDVSAVTGGGRTIPHLCKCRTGPLFPSHGGAALLLPGGSIPGPGVALGGAEDAASLPLLMGNGSPRAASRLFPFVRLQRRNCARLFPKRCQKRPGMLAALARLCQDGVRSASLKSGRWILKEGSGRRHPCPSPWWGQRGSRARGPQGWELT